MLAYLFFIYFHDRSTINYPELCIRNRLPNLEGAHLNKKLTIMIQGITNDTPLALLTVKQFASLLETTVATQPSTPALNNEKKYEYGIRGIARIFGCSIPTANRIKRSGRIDGAIKQIGRKIIIDADLALELAGRKTGGRK